MVDNQNMPDEMVHFQRQELARRYVEIAEKWLRQLIHYQLSKQGPNYITKGQWKKSLIEHVYGRIRVEPEKYPREIDATTFEQAVSIVCHPNYWEHLFEVPLNDAYPHGREEARTFLNRLVDIRNDVSHGKGCSARQLERAICYGNDLADSIKAFFKGEQMQREYNVPTIVRYTDNRGNASSLEGVSTNINNRIIDWRRTGGGDLRPGDTLVAEVEIDPTFDSSEYTVSWYISGNPRQTGAAATIRIENKHVGEQVELRFDVVTHRDWHRFTGKDDGLILIYRVLPPV
jgi:hypothetical protein